MTACAVEAKRSAAKRIGEARARSAWALNLVGNEYLMRCAERASDFPGKHASATEKETFFYRGGASERGAKWQAALGQVGAKVTRGVRRAQLPEKEQLVALGASAEARHMSSPPSPPLSPSAPRRSLLAAPRPLHSARTCSMSLDASASDRVRGWMRACARISGRGGDRQGGRGRQGVGAPSAAAGATGAARTPHTLALAKCRQLTPADGKTAVVRHRRAP